jgi:hypothetical protein
MVVCLVLFRDARCQARHLPICSPPPRTWTSPCFSMSDKSARAHATLLCPARVRPRRMRLGCGGSAGRARRRSMAWRVPAESAQPCNTPSFASFAAAEAALPARPRRSTAPGQLRVVDRRGARVRATPSGANSGVDNYTFYASSAEEDAPIDYGSRFPSLLKPRPRRDHPGSGATRQRRRRSWIVGALPATVYARQHGH